MMFEQLIESEPEGAEFHNRKSYFMASTAVVGVLFFTAVVISIYAADYSLGGAAFELVEMVAPPEMAATAPEPLTPRHERNTSAAGLPTRRENMMRIDEEPAVAPISISTTRNTQLERPPGRFLVAGNRIETNSGGDGPGSGRDTSGSGLPSAGFTSAAAVPNHGTEVEVVPPPIKQNVALKPPPVQSLGVINGRAASLPKPVYPAAALAVHADGKVDVQVTIDETGRVISAHAVSGNVMLRQAAEQAARNARFTTTYLSNVPVKVTGVIVYNFTR